MPEEGVQLTPKAHLMSLSERKRLISIFASLGVTKLRFTGGEPTISNQLEELIAHAHSCNIRNIGITSNGLILKERLDGLIKAGLTSVNISLDTLIDTKFASITRRDKKNIYRVLSSVYTAVSKGLPVKINCVLVRGLNDGEIAQFVNLTKAVKVDFRFIELMPFDGNEWKSESFISYIEIIDRLKTEYGIELKKELGVKRKPRVARSEPLLGSAAADDSVPVSDSDSDSHGRGGNGPGKEPGQGQVQGEGEGQGFDPSDTTKWYRASPEHEGRVGFITSMSSNFCGSCNRLRVTADGQLKVCLFGEDGFNILQSMRDGASDEEIIAHLNGTVKQKKRALGGHATPADIASNSSSNRPMILIGG